MHFVAGAPPGCGPSQLGVCRWVLSLPSLTTLNIKWPSEHPLPHGAAWVCHSAHVLGPVMGTMSITCRSRSCKRKLFALKEGQEQSRSGGLPESFLCPLTAQTLQRGAFPGSVSCPHGLQYSPLSVSPSPSPFPPLMHKLRAPQPRGTQATTLALDLPPPPKLWGCPFCPSLPTSHHLYGPQWTSLSQRSPTSAF